MHQPVPIPLPSPEREIISSRIFHWSKEKIFAAWSDPDWLQKWWGPKGFTNTFHVFDFTPGGHWKLTMHGPEKGNYENESVFQEIIPGELIYWHRLTQPYFNVVVTFEKVDDDHTKLVFRMIFPSEEGRAKVIQFVPAANEENFDRLEQVLKQMP
ncbi:SRPBCC family protein [Flavobacterium longum]|uniref:SRPBCC family protein n=1 Tax=Flavobacterium longum TaxID=1299340 RepID=UPI0039ECF40B